MKNKDIRTYLFWAILGIFVGYVIFGRGSIKVDVKKYDFLIANLVTQTAFYVLPAEAIKTKMHILFYPNGKTTKIENDYESFRDAWHLLK